VSVELEPPGIIEAGANAHVTPVAVRARQIDRAVESTRCAGVDVSVVEPPRITVAEGAERPRAKSFRRPRWDKRSKQPVRLRAPPRREIKRVSISCAAGANTISHKPGLAITVPLLSASWLRKAPAVSNALIVPSPKSDQDVVRKGSEVGDVATTPQGAFSVPPVAIRRMNLPSVWNRLTTPSPTPTSGSCFRPILHRIITKTTL